MQLYSHIFSLRVAHPSLDPELVTQVLGLKPKRSWRAGERRQTPKGTPLQGVYSEGCWSSNPFEYSWRESTDTSIEDALEELVNYLEPHTAFLKGIGNDGGRVTIWVSSQSTRNYAVELSPNFLGRLAVLGTSIVYDVYPGP